MRCSRAIRLGCTSRALKIDGKDAIVANNYLVQLTNIKRCSEARAKYSEFKKRGVKFNAFTSRRVRDCTSQ